MSDDLKSFKISDTAKVGAEKKRPSAGGGGGKGGGKEAVDEATASVGFPHIEAEVEHDGPGLPGLAERYAALEEMAKTSKAQKDKSAAKKASVAYERTHELLEHLLATKAKLAGGDPPG